MTIGSPAQVLTKLAVWILEIIAEAYGTCLVIIAVAFLAAHGGNNDLSLHKVLGIVAFILIEFAVTGYLATTVISRFALQNRKQRFYPLVSAALYLLHSTIFFVAAGNDLFRSDDLIIQFSGACLTFTCTSFGNWLLGRWSIGGRIALADNT